MDNFNNSPKSFVLICMLWTLHVVFQSPVSAKIENYDGMSSVNIDGITYWGGISTLDQNRLLLVGANTMPHLTFSPKNINITDKEFGKPVFTVITVTNVSPDLLLDLVSIRTSEFILLFKPLNATVLEPGKAIQLSLLIVPYRTGHVKVHLYITTNGGSATYTVYCNFAASKFNLQAIQTNQFRSSLTYKYFILFYNPYPFPLKIEEVYLTGSSLIQTDENSLRFVSTTRKSQQKHYNTSNETFPIQFNTVIVQGQQEIEICSLEFSSLESLNAKSFITGSINVAFPSDSVQTNVLNSSYNYFLSNTTIDPDFFIIPIKLNFTSYVDFQIAETALIFGLLRSSDPPKTLRLTAYNRLSTPLSIIVSNDYIENDFVQIQYDPVLFPDDSRRGVNFASITLDPALARNSGEILGHISVNTFGEFPPILVEYRVTIVKGNLQFNTPKLSFYCGPLNPNNVSLVSYEVEMLNTFEFPLQVQGFHLPEEYSNAFKVMDFSNSQLLLPQTGSSFVVKFEGPEIGHICEISRTSLTVFTNASSFTLPLILYTAQLKITSSDADDNGGCLDFGLLEAEVQYSFGVFISNPNPVPITIDQLLLYMPEGVSCLDIDKKHRSPSLCHHLAVVSTSEEGVCSSYPLVLQASSWTQFSLPFNHPNADTILTWTLVANSTLMSSSKSLRFRVSSGRLSGKPEILHLGSAFSGKSVFRNLVVHNSYLKSMMLASVSFRPSVFSPPMSELASVLPRFRMEPGGHVTRTVSTNISADVASDSIVDLSVTLESHRATLIGSVSFDASADCDDVLSDVQDLYGELGKRAPSHTLKPTCYTGFDLSSQKGRYWFASLFFPYATEGTFPSTFKAPHRILHSLFSTGLRFSTLLSQKLSKAWIKLIQDVHKQTVGSDITSMNTQTSKCLLPGKVILSTPKASFSNPVLVKLIWPRILSDKLVVTQGIGGSGAKKNHDKQAVCELKFDLVEGLPIPNHISQLIVKNSISEDSVCRLTLINPSEKTLFIQVIVLDDFIQPDTANLTTIMKQFSEEFLEAAQLPKLSDIVPKDISARSGRFSARIESTTVDESSLVSLRNIIRLANPEPLVMPSCCPLYALPPNGGQATYVVTYKPGVYNPASSGFQRFDNSILLIRNNLTSIEPVLLKAVTRLASLSIFNGFCLNDASEFPTSTGSPADSMVNFNSHSTGRNLKEDNVCESVTCTMSAEPLMLFELRSDIFCSNNDESTICHLPSVSSINSLSFEFHEGHLKALCTDIGGIPRPSISHFISSLKRSLWSEPLVNEKSGPSAADPRQTVWAVDKTGQPIFATEFLSDLSLTRRIALYNSGSLPLWVLKMGFVRSPATKHEKIYVYHRCKTRFQGFSFRVCGCANDGVESFELKPGDRQWLDILYTPDFLHSSVRVQFVVFVSLKLPNSTIANVEEFKEQIILTSNDDKAACNTSFECDLFQLASFELTARISTPLTKLCHASIIRPSIEDILWTSLFFLFVINLAGIFIIATFDADRVLAVYESIRLQVSSSPGVDADGPSGTFFNLNFNLPHCSAANANEPGVYCQSYNGIVGAPYQAIPPDIDEWENKGEKMRRVTKIGCLHRLVVGVENLCSCFWRFITFKGFVNNYLRAESSVKGVIVSPASTLGEKKIKQQSEYTNGLMLRKISNHGSPSSVKRTSKQALAKQGSDEKLIGLNSPSNASGDSSFSTFWPSRSQPKILSTSVAELLPSRRKLTDSPKAIRQQLPPSNSKTDYEDKSEWQAAPISPKCRSHQNRVSSTIFLTQPSEAVTATTAAGVAKSTPVLFMESICVDSASLRLKKPKRGKPATIVAGQPELQASPFQMSRPWLSTSNTINATVNQPSLTKPVSSKSKLRNVSTIGSSLNNHPNLKKHVLMDEVNSKIGGKPVNCSKPGLAWQMPPPVHPSAAEPPPPNPKQLNKQNLTNYPQPFLTGEAGTLRGPGLYSYLSSPFYRNASLRPMFMPAFIAASCVGGSRGPPQYCPPLHHRTPWDQHYYNKMNRAVVKPNKPVPTKEIDFPPLGSKYSLNQQPLPTSATEQMSKSDKDMDRIAKESYEFEREMQNLGSPYPYHGSWVEFPPPREGFYQPGLYRNPEHSPPIMMRYSSTLSDEHNSNKAHLENFSASPLPNYTQSYLNNCPVAVVYQPLSTFMYPEEIEASATPYELGDRVFFKGHRRRRSSTGQFVEELSSSSPAPTYFLSSRSSTDLAIDNYVQRITCRNTLLFDEIAEIENMDEKHKQYCQTQDDLFESYPEWLDALDQPEVELDRETKLASTLNELEQFTLKRRERMLSHESRQMTSRIKSFSTADATILNGSDIGLATPPRRTSLPACPDVKNNEDTEEDEAMENDSENGVLPSNSMTPRKLVFSPSVMLPDRSSATWCSSWGSGDRSTQMQRRDCSFGGVSLAAWPPATIPWQRVGLNDADHDVKKNKSVEETPLEFNSVDVDEWIESEWRQSYSVRRGAHSPGGSCYSNSTSNYTVQPIGSTHRKAKQPIGGAKVSTFDFASSSSSDTDQSGPWTPGSGVDLLLSLHSTGGH